MKSRKITKEKLLAGIKQHSETISDARDQLRALIADAEEICQDSDEAIQELDLAVEYLSRNL